MVRHAAALVLAYWILFLNTGPPGQEFNEWAGNFSTKHQCEQALLREQTRQYDMNPDEDPDNLDRHVHGKNADWVRGLPGFCKSSTEVLVPPTPGK